MSITAERRASDFARLRRFAWSPASTRAPGAGGPAVAGGLVQHRVRRDRERAGQPRLGARRGAAPDRVRDAEHVLVLGAGPRVHSRLGCGKRGGDVCGLRVRGCVAEAAPTRTNRPTAVSRTTCLGWRMPIPLSWFSKGASPVAVKSSSAACKDFVRTSAPKPEPRSRLAEHADLRGLVGMTRVQLIDRRAARSERPRIGLRLRLLRRAAEELLEKLREPSIESSSQHGEIGFAPNERARGSSGKLDGSASPRATSRSSPTTFSTRRPAAAWDTVSTRVDWLASLPDLDPHARPERVLAEPGFERWEGRGALGYLTLAAICRGAARRPAARTRA